MSFQMLSPVLSIDLKIVDICHTCPIEKSYCAIFIILSAIYSPQSYCSMFMRILHFAGMRMLVLTLK